MKPRIAVSYTKKGVEPEKDRAFNRIETWADIDYYDPEKEHPEFSTEEFRDTYDLYHMAKTRDQSLEDLRRAEENNVPTLNKYSAAKLADDRYESLKTLEKAGIKIPKTEYCQFKDTTLTLPAVTKPRFEGGGHIIQLLEQPYTGEKLVQQLIDYDKSLKIYQLGDEKRAVQLDGKEMLGRDYDTAVEIEVDRYLNQLSESIRRASGLELFEADIIEKDGELYTVDINSMVGLQNIKDSTEIYSNLIREKLGMETETSIIEQLFPVYTEPAPERA